MINFFLKTLTLTGIISILIWLAVVVMLLGAAQNIYLFFTGVQ